MIWGRSSVSLGAALIIACFQPIEATECATKSIGNQTDADAISAACKSINGDLVISTNYQGTLNLPGLVNISGTIGDADGIIPYLTSVTFEDLESVGSIQLLGGIGIQQALELVDFPSLTTIANSSIYGELPVNVSLPSLENAARVDFMGNFSSISLPKLQAVDEYFSVDTKLECDDCHEINREHLLNVTIPSLLTAKKLFLWGDFSSISFPNLEAVQDSIVIGSEQALNVEFDSLQMVAHGIWLSWAINSIILPYFNSSLGFTLDLNTPLNIDIPSPGNISSINITGNCSLVTFPSLTSFVSDMSIEDNITSISFPYLTSVIGSMSFTGYISSILFPALILFDGPLTIISNTTIDCDQYNTLYQNATELVHNQNGEAFPFTCQVLSDREKEVRKKLGIGLGIGLAAGLLGGLIWYRIKRKRNKTKERLKKIRELQMELEMRDLSRSATLVGTIRE